MNVVQVVGRSPVLRAGLARLLKAMDAPQRARLNDPFRVVDLSGISAGDRVLEVGCGSGFFTPALSAAVGACGTVDSIDLHPMSVAVQQPGRQASSKRTGRRGTVRPTSL